MAIGDAAGAKGLKVYSASDLVTLGYQQNNQRGDEIAAVMARADKLETQSIGVPKFGVRKSTNGTSLPSDLWKLMAAEAWASPHKNVGGFTWSGGVLRVPRAGVYSVLAHMKPYADDYYAIAIEVTKNTTEAGTANSIATAEVYPGDRASNTSNMVAPSVTASEPLVPLNAGDLLRVLCYERNYGANTTQLNDRGTDLSLSVIWQDSL